MFTNFAILALHCCDLRLEFRIFINICSSYSCCHLICTRDIDDYLSSCGHQGLYKFSLHSFTWNIFSVNAESPILQYWCSLLLWIRISLKFFINFFFHKFQLLPFGMCSWCGLVFKLVWPFFYFLTCLLSVFLIGWFGVHVRNTMDFKFMLKNVRDGCVFLLLETKSENEATYSVFQKICNCMWCTIIVIVIWFSFFSFLLLPKTVFLLFYIIWRIFKKQFP